MIPVANMEETYGIGKRLDVHRIAKFEKLLSDVNYTFPTKRFRLPYCSVIRYVIALVKRPTRFRSCYSNVERRKAIHRGQRLHHKLCKCSSLHSEALDRYDCAHAFDDIQSQIYERRTVAACKSINEFCER